VILGRLPPLQARHVLVRHDLRHRRPQHLVAAGMVGMVVGVQQQVDPPGRAGLEPVEKELGAVGELTVNDDHRICRGEPRHRAAARGEDADVPADRREDGPDRRFLSEHG
jgi:hypothetical protein